MIFINRGWVPLKAEKALSSTGSRPEGQVTLTCVVSDEEKVIVTCFLNEQIEKSTAIKK